jgi:hypothetical protein
MAASIVTVSATIRSLFIPYHLMGVSRHTGARAYTGENEAPRREVTVLAENLMGGR